MWMFLFLTFLPQAASSALNYDLFKEKVQPLLAEKRPGHARCVTCHSTGTAFRLQPLPKGQTAWSDEQSQKNFEMVKKFVRTGNPKESRLLVMTLAHEAGGTEFHPGGKHWESHNDPEWKALADWVNGTR